jgi:Rad3-related DNA helicase
VTNVMSYFPLKTPRASQRDVILAIHGLFNQYDIVVLEGPVGSGKSAIAETLIKAMGPGHILTPRKSLQDQYMEDFQKEGLVTMKGKGSYPCLPSSGVFPSPDAQGHDTDYAKACTEISNGWSDFHNLDKGYGSARSVGRGFCVKNGKRSQALADKCQGIVRNAEGAVIEEAARPCPFYLAVAVAQGAHQVAHNLHSFLYQNFYGAYFTKRPLLVIDEAHDLEGVVRDFVSKTLSLDLSACKRLSRNGVDFPSNDASMSDWINYLSRPAFTPDKESDPEGYEQWIEKLEFMDAVAETFLADRVVHWEDVPEKNSRKVTFVPRTMGSAPANLFLQYGEKVLLMSGTIYDKDYFCRRLGLPANKVAFVRLASEFPLATRPVIIEKSLTTVNSFQAWKEDPAAYPSMLANIRTIMDRHPNVKGLIHAPSYQVAYDMAAQLTARIVHHTPDSFQEVLKEFYQRTDNAILISPICQQGVDFKYDRARFQIVVRVPYLNSSDPFIQQMMKKDFPWYNYQSLIAFGQMLGRVNRAPDDFGVTYLLDARFYQYLRRNDYLLPAWQKAAIRKV